MLPVGRPGIPTPPRVQPPPPPRNEGRVSHDPSPRHSPATPSRGHLELHPNLEAAALRKQADVNSRFEGSVAGAEPECIYDNIEHDPDRARASQPRHNESNAIGPKDTSMIEKMFDKDGNFNPGRARDEARSSTSEGNRSQSARPANPVTRFFTAIREFFTQCFRPRTTDTPYPAHNSPRASQPAQDPGVNYADIDHSGKGPGRAPAAQFEPNVVYAEVRKKADRDQGAQDEVKYAVLQHRSHSPSSPPRSTEPEVIYSEVASTPPSSAHSSPTAAQPLPDLAHHRTSPSSGSMSPPPTLPPINAQQPSPRNDDAYSEEPIYENAAEYRRQA